MKIQIILLIGVFRTTVNRPSYKIFSTTFMGNIKKFQKS